MSRGVPTCAPGVVQNRFRSSTKEAATTGAHDLSANKCVQTRELSMQANQCSGKSVVQDNCVLHKAKKPLVKACVFDQVLETWSTLPSLLQIDASKQKLEIVLARILGKLLPRTMMLLNVKLGLQFLL